MGPAEPVCVFLFFWRACFLGVCGPVWVFVCFLDFFGVCFDLETSSLQFTTFYFCLIMQWLCFLSLISNFTAMFWRHCLFEFIVAQECLFHQT